MRVFVGLVLAALTLAFAAPGAAADADFPTRSIRLILPFPPGNSTDSSGRLMAERMASALGQPVVVENRPGAGGQVGSKVLADSKPDGYTIGLVTNGTHGAAGSVFNKLAYDPLKDFSYLGRYALVPWALAVRPDFPAKDVAQFLSQAKASKQPFGGSHTSGSSRLALLLLSATAGVPIVEIAYNGPLQVLTDLGNGQLQFAMLTLESASNGEKLGKARVLAVTSKYPIAAFPDAPPLSNTLRDFEIVSWLALAAPAGLAADVERRLRAAFVDAISHPAVQESLRALQMTPIAPTPEKLTDVITAENQQWRNAAKSLDIKPAN